MKKISLTTMILLALVLGMIIGVVLNNTASPETAKLYAQEISIFTTIFLRLIKMIIAPLVVSTLVVGIAKMGDAKALGRIFSKTLFLFICASLLSIALGLITVNFFMPGTGINFVAHGAETTGVVASEPFTLKVFISHAFPTSIVDAMLKLTGYVMLFAPLTVFAAISALIAERGLAVMVSAGIFMGEFYFTMLLLWVLLIGLAIVYVGPCIRRLTRALSEPALLAFTTSSSEAAFPGTLEKLEQFGVSPKIASFVLPIGYSFNLVGSMAYCSFATVFIAQACNIHLSIGEQITMLLILMLTSKGMAGVPRASMVVIAATLNQFNIPEAGLILLMGVDPFLDMGRSATNVMSNAMGAAMVSRWKGEHFGEGCRGKALKPNESNVALP
ncbi:dicarboxylate/amino acid:cation symporter [Escherichia coli]|uniref:dicarboxylate/amino acid:cation symporter n=1 Tax=Escherichia coli TaxID=562 RepID=UPI0037C02CD9